MLGSNTGASSSKTLQRSLLLMAAFRAGVKKDLCLAKGYPGGRVSLFRSHGESVSSNEDRPRGTDE